jgi:hypothetical protein
MMSAVDWQAKATLQQRDDAGSDMFVQFDTIGQGTLAEMVARVMAMPPHDRARVVLDVAGRGMLDVGQIGDLSRRADFPG